MSNEWSDADFDLHFGQIDRGVATTSASMLIKYAPTGAAPVLALTDDGRRFWLKWPGNPHGNVSLVNELVVSRIGELIEAPVRPSALVYVSSELAQGFKAAGHSIPAGTYYGSELLPEVEEATEIVRVHKDGNAHRFPKFLALWTLCLGTDLQLLYHVSHESQVWSIDHGLWFCSDEGDWTQTMLERWTRFVWQWPGERRPKGLSSVAFHEVASSIGGLTMASLAAVVAEVPPEWGVPDADLKALARFIHLRRDPTARQLREIAAQYSKGRD